MIIFWRDIYNEDVWLDCIQPYIYDRVHPYISPALINGLDPNIHALVMSAVRWKMGDGRHSFVNIQVPCLSLDSCWAVGCVFLLELLLSVLDNAVLERYM